MLVKAQEKDLSLIMEIINDAKIYLKNQNSLQWNLPDGYPRREDLLKDIKNESCYLYLENNEIIGTMSILFTPDENYFEIDGKVLEPYIDYYFEVKKYTGIPRIVEEEKCEELIWADVKNLPEPFINYEGVFLEDKTIKTYDCLEDGAYVKKLKR